MVSIKKLPFLACDQSDKERAVQSVQRRGNFLAAEKHGKMT